MPTATPERVQAVRRFSRFYTKRIGALRPDLLESPYSLSEVRVLFELAQQPGLTASVLASTLDIDPGYISRMLGTFEDEGLVSRTRSPEDGRQWLVSLTARGRRTIGNLNDRSSRQVADMLAGLPDEQQRSLVTAMRTIETVLGPDRDCPAFVLRPHRPGDLGLVTWRHGVLYQSEHGFDPSFEALVAEIMVKFFRGHDPERERMWIAERDGAFAGSIMCAASGRHVAQLRLLLVEPSVRGQGLGRLLVDTCIRFAQDAGYRRMTLFTQSCLHDARRIYERCGFELAKTDPARSFAQGSEGQWWERAL